MKKTAKIYIAGHQSLVGAAIWKNLKEKGYTNLIGRSDTELNLQSGVAVKKFFDEEQPEYVILAATYAKDIMTNAISWVDFIYKNIQIQQHIVSESFYHGVKKLIYLGSNYFYPQYTECLIEYSSLITYLKYTNRIFTISNISGLNICENFNLQYGTNYISVMPTNLYGPNDDFNMDCSHLLPTMMRQLYLAQCLKADNWKAICHDLDIRPMNGINGSSNSKYILSMLKCYGIGKEKVELWGDSTSLCEFLWSEEMADATVFIMEHVDFKDIYPMGIKGTHKCHIDIGTGKEISFSTLADLIIKETGYKGTITFNSEQPDGTIRKQTDVSKLHELGWHHKIDIEEGVHKMYQCYLEYKME